MTGTIDTRPSDTTAHGPTLTMPGRVAMWVFGRIADAAPSAGRTLQHALIRSWYSFVSRLSKRIEDVTFLNYGYAPLDDGGAATVVEPNSIDERFGSALYQNVAGSRDLRGKDVLEVGCGRGGGSSYVARQLGPRSVVGVDFAASAVAFCRRRHRADNLSFKEGDAEDLPFGSESFDAVINVESSHCYPSVERFLSEVSRVLKPGGAFLFADLRNKADVPKLRNQLAQVFTIEEEESITRNVHRALELHSEHREALIRERVPAALRKSFRNFAAVRGTVVFEALASGEVEYVRFVLRKPLST